MPWKPSTPLYRLSCHISWLTVKLHKGTPYTPKIFALPRRGKKDSPIRLGCYNSCKPSRPLNRLSFQIWYLWVKQWSRRYRCQKICFNPGSHPMSGVFKIIVLLLLSKCSRFENFQKITTFQVITCTTNKISIKTLFIA